MKAIYTLYSNVVTIREEVDGSVLAFDKDNNAVEINMTDVNNWVDPNGYKLDRAIAYPNVQDFMEAYTEKEIGGSSTKWNAYVTAYNKVRSDNAKPE